MNRILPEDAQLTDGQKTAVPADGIQPRVIGAVNWLGLWTLYEKEVRRFLKVFMQTLLAPVITTLLFLAIFSLALGGAVRQVAGVPFIEFLAPGLVMMAMVQNSFQNTASSILISKVQGNIVDVLMPPLSPGELTLAYVGAGATRGLLVGAVTVVAMSFFVPIQLQAPLTILYFATMAAILLSLLGLIGGIWSDKFDHMAAVTNFVITPAAFLSGTFYSIDRLPGIWNSVAHANPFFFMIDGFRSGFIGRADGHLLVGGIVLLVLNIALWLVCVRMFKVGYKLKS